MASLSCTESVNKTAEHLGREKIKLQGELENIRHRKNNLEMLLYDKNFEFDSCKQICNKLRETVVVTKHKLEQSQVRHTITIPYLSGMTKVHYHYQLIIFTKKHTTRVLKVCH